MRYIEQFREGMRVSDVYLCKTKQHAVTKNGKEYASVLLQDKTGTVDCKIWDLSSPGINDFEPLQYVYVDGDEEEETDMTVTVIKVDGKWYIGWGTIEY